MVASKAQGRFCPWQAGSKSGHVWGIVGLINLRDEKPVRLDRWKTYILTVIAVRHYVYYEKFHFSPRIVTIYLK